MIACIELTMSQSGGSMGIFHVIKAIMSQVTEKMMKYSYQYKSYEYKLVGSISFQDSLIEFDSVRIPNL